MNTRFEIPEPKSDEEVVKERLRESLNPAILILQELVLKEDK